MNLSVKKALFVLFLARSFCAPSFCRAAAIVSAGSGNWSSAATWNPAQVPTASDSVTILSAHAVTIDALTATASTMTVNGVLKFSRVASSRLVIVGGNITVNAGGTLDMGTAASPIPSGVNAQLVLAYGASPAQYGLIVNQSGTFTVHGAAKTPYGFAGSDALAGATSLTIPAAQAAGWAVGDSIVIGKTQKSGNDETELRALTGVSGTDPLTLSWSSPLVNNHYSTGPLNIGMLTHNVLVRSSGTDITANSAYIKNSATSSVNFSLIDGEFAYLGANASNDKLGIMTYYGGGALISSCSIHEGYVGIGGPGSSGNIYSYNFLYKSGYNPNTGGFVNGSSGIGVANNDMAVGNDLMSNNNCVSFYYSNNNTVAYNICNSNANGIGMWQSVNNTIVGNVICSNYYSGGNPISVAGSLTGGNLVVSNKAYFNEAVGLNINGGAFNNTLISNYFYGSFYWSGRGVEYSGSNNNTIVGGAFGYDPQGNSLPAPSAELWLQPGGTENLTLKSVRINPAAGISQGFSVPGSYLLSYNQDASSGTVKLWGDYVVSGATMTLDYASRLYSSTATIPKLMSGAGHGAVICSTYDSGTVSQLVTIQYSAALGQWQVSGSSSGFLGAVTSFSASCPGTDYPLANPQFNLAFTQGPAPQDGDTVDFVLIGASNDAGVQKKMLFESAASGFNYGRARLSIAPNGGFVLSGTAANPGLMNLDALNAAATFYTFIDSGAFTVANATIANADESGLQLSGSAGVSMFNTVFDWAGNGVSSTSAYITARGLSSSGSFLNMMFNNSRPNSAMRSVRVSGVDTGLNWTFLCANGALSGISSAEDPNNRIIWGLSKTPQPSFSAVYVSSLSATWLPVCSAAGFVLQASTASAGPSTLAGTLFTSSTTNSSVTSLAVAGLTPNTSYFAQVDSLNGGSTFYSTLIATVTLAATPNPITITGASAVQFTVNWPANGNPGNTVYEVTLATASGFGVVTASQTVAATSATFTTANSAIAPGNTYFVRVRAFNSAGTPTPYVLGIAATVNGAVNVSALQASGSVILPLANAWYNISSATFFAQGAATYYYEIGVATYIPSPGIDPSFNGSAMSLGLPQGSLYFNVLGVSSGIAVGVQHFGPINVDRGSPSIQSISAQASATDSTPITSGATTLATQPQFTWTSQAGLSPIVGYSISVSTVSGVAPAFSASVSQPPVTASLTVPGATYFKVMALNLAGNWGPPATFNFTFSAVPGADLVKLKQNYFNPGRGECMQLEVDAASAGHVKAELYTLLGQRVATMADQDVAPGVYSYPWCGKNASGRTVATGVYLVHIEAPGQKKDFQVVVAR